MRRQVQPAVFRRACRNAPERCDRMRQARPAGRALGRPRPDSPVGVGGSVSGPGQSVVRRHRGLRRELGGGLVGRGCGRCEAQDPRGRPGEVRRGATLPRLPARPSGRYATAFWAPTGSPPPAGAGRRGARRARRGTSAPIRDSTTDPPDTHCGQSLPPRPRRLVDEDSTDHRTRRSGVQRSTSVPSPNDSTTPINPTVTAFPPAGAGNGRRANAKPMSTGPCSTKAA